jgi:hypothetical protein
MLKTELAAIFAVEMLRKSGVRDWEDTAVRESIETAAAAMAEALYFGDTMATSKLLIPEFDGTPKALTFADFAGDFSPTAANDLRHASVADTDVQVALAGIANNTAWQSARFDFGAVRGPMVARAAFELAATPTAGNVIELYIGYSQHATAGTGNPGNLTGSSAAYSGYSSNLDASLKHLSYIGEFVCTAQATATVQVGRASRIFVPRERYGILVIYNKSGAAFHSDDVECHVVLDPVFWQGQAA